MIEIKRPITGWQEASKDEAKQFVLFLMDSTQAIPQNEKAAYINENRLRAIKMLTVKVTLDDNNWFVTRMNATREEALAYYGIGEVFNMGGVHDDMREVVGVEVLSD